MDTDTRRDAAVLPTPPTFDLDAIRARADAVASEEFDVWTDEYVSQLEASQRDVPALLAEVARLHNNLAELSALRATDFMREAVKASARRARELTCDEAREIAAGNWDTVEYQTGMAKVRDLAEIAGDR
jgi:hypothetical protein